jgi:hypothetical protein
MGSTHPERPPQLGGVDPLDSHQLVTRPLPADDLNPSPGDAQALGKQLPQRVVRRTADRRRGHAHKERAVTLAHDLVSACPRLQTHADLRSGHYVKTK